MAAKQSVGASKRCSRRVRDHFEHLPEELLVEILSRLPPHKIFQLQTVCNSWRTILFSSHHFRQQWRERNMDEIIPAKINSSSSAWSVKASCSDFLIYASNKSGMLRLFDPLKMESLQIPDQMLGHKLISKYLKKDTDSIDVDVDSTGEGT
ncbi:hypothetical protein KI387_021553, partial [Taxus chinensis]